MPRFYPNTRFSDCWSSVGDVTYYHRNGVCYFRSKAYSEFAGTAEQLEQKALHHRAIRAWKDLSGEAQEKWRRYADGVAAHRPPYGDGNSISGYNLFVSAYHGFAQLGNEHTPTPKRFEPFPIFSLDFVRAETVSLFELELKFKLTLCGTNKFIRYRVLGKIQIEEPSVGRHPGKMRNFLSSSVPNGASSEISFVIPRTRTDLDVFQIHIRYLLLDTVTGYRSQYHSLSSLAKIL
ncbi:MAG: hypothetical protein NC115_05175 [Bacteroidales bacterium]|nr:hypothetical protein [Bacteroidales bacterium]